MLALLYSNFVEERWSVLTVQKILVLPVVFLDWKSFPCFYRDIDLKKRIKALIT